MSIQLVLPIPTLLTNEEVIAAYERVAAIYPHIPPLSMWRAWEVAAYARYQLPTPALDVGCGDGAFFRLTWPHVADVVGVDSSPTAIAAARASGVYKEVHLASADELPFRDGRFAGAFANCSLEHMDNIARVLDNVAQSLQPGGLFIFSVITDKYREWAKSLLAIALGAELPRAQAAQAAWEACHHIANPLCVEAWADHLGQAGFEILEYVPIVPQPCASLFLLLDQIWHAKTESGELGEYVHRYLTQMPDFPRLFGQVLARLLSLSHDDGASCGVVFQARKIAPRPAAVSFRCWCGGDEELERFSDEYQRCPHCQTLVSTARLSDEELRVQYDETSFYGRNYWLDHQTQDYGHPDIHQRARLDLPERCVHWLRTLLKYKLPPGRVLELGAAHGGFVSLLRMAGFDATGLEMSPWVADLARKTFDVPMLVGPVEEQSLPPESFDVIALMDVLEHLPDPEQTMAHCFRLLRPDGMLLIQTPWYRLTSHEKMLADNDRFLIQLKASEHLFLFSQRAVRLLFQRLGAWEVIFEPAIFDYDMFLAVSRCELKCVDATARENALERAPSSRLARALTDIYERTAMLQQAADERLRVIHVLDKEVKRLTSRH
jgi:2-polyprenyl-3-methyl-5-hydroxy-6-metoxy-1,4-benzoquinol methylase